MRASLIARLSLLTATTVALPTLLACLDHPLKRVEYDAAQEDMEGIQIEVNKDVDILFVVDNSGSMGEEQANLSENFGRFVSVLEADDVKANYRLGITTTDDSNYWCKGAGVSDAESGQFVLSSCRSRLGDFYFSGDDTDAEAACTDFCVHESINIQPTITDEDPNPSVRPWLENIEGATNLPDGVTTTEALQCFGPQGINGCGFESHLESMWKALRLARMSDQNQSGFLRDNAILSIVFVTDEADCSFNRELQNTVFGEEGVGNQAFWSLPDVQQSPTSAVCWNAGVSCDFGLDSNQCVSINLDVDGNETSDDDLASLYPLSKYTTFVQEIEADKKVRNPGQEVIVSAIAGVPENYPMIQQLSYAEGADATNPDSFQARFGIGQGCSSQVAEAVPPVRLREFAETFLIGDDDNNLFSVCSTDYGPALGAIAESIRDQLKPACMPACVADTEAVDEGLQPRCTLTQTSNDGSGTVEDNIPECGDGGAVPEGSDVCFVNLVDQNGTTATEDDDMQAACIDAGWNLEFRVNRREGVPAPGGA
ncbi:MAG: VWA domain-containing protein, partial [Nannocystaceae bacterium]|nr:VWA domain-containing protein [Nannocystaceae bacterium]